MDINNVLKSLELIASQDEKERNEVSSIGKGLPNSM